MDQSQAIGIFDSGLGGISVLKEMRLLMPQEHFLYFGDSAYAPYGIKEKEEITKRCIAICDDLVARGVKAIVVACNTATSACVDVLRARYALPIIGMEPALKVACELGKQQHIIVMATPLTLKEEKFAKLMERFQDDHVIYRQPCPRLVEIVEQDELGNRELVFAQLQEYLFRYDLSKIDSIVLGCTHFVFYRSYFEELLPAHIHLIDGNHGTGMHLKELLIQSGQLCTHGKGSVHIENSCPDESLIRLCEKLLGGIDHERKECMGNV